MKVAMVEPHTVCQEGCVQQHCMEIEHQWASSQELFKAAIW